MHHTSRRRLILGTFNSFANPRQQYLICHQSMLSRTPIIILHSKCCWAFAILCPSERYKKKLTIKIKWLRIIFQYSLDEIALSRINKPKIYRVMNWILHILIFFGAILQYIKKLEMLNHREASRYCQKHQYRGNTFIIIVIHTHNSNV